MTDSQVYCPSCRRKVGIVAGRYGEHYRKTGRQGGRCSQSGGLVVAVSERAA